MVANAYYAGNNVTPGSIVFNIQQRSCRYAVDEFDRVRTKTKQAYEGRRRKPYMYAIIIIIIISIITASSISRELLAEKIDIFNNVDFIINPLTIYYLET